MSKESVSAPSTTPEFSRPLRVSRLEGQLSVPFDETATDEECAALARLYDAITVKKMKFSGELTPYSGAGWRLNGTLGATVVQKCVVTLAPVTTRIDTSVTRLFLPEPAMAAEAIDVDADGDDETELLGKTIDLGLVATEATALALPAYPRADGAALETSTFAADGVTPLTDETAKPFASLAALKDRLDKPQN